MRRHWMTVGWVASILALAIAAELASPGFWLLTAQVIGLMLAKVLAAYMLVAGFVVVGFLSWRAGRNAGRRDALRDVAQATGTVVRLRKVGGR